MKNPSVPWRCGSTWTTPSPSGAHSGRTDRAGRRAGSRARRSRKTVDLALVLVRRDRARRVHERAARAHAVRGRVQQARLLAGQRARPPPSSFFQRTSGRDWSVPRSEHGGSSSTRSNSPSTSAASASRTSRMSRPAARSSRRAPSRGRRASRPPRPRRRCRSAPRGAWPCAPGAAHRSSTRSPGCGSSARATSIDARDCGMIAPSLKSCDPCTSNWPLSTRPSGRSSAGDVSTPWLGERRRHLAPASRAARSRARRSRPARCRARISAIVSAGPSASHHMRTSHSGCECADRRLGGAVVGQLRRSARPPRAPRGASPR